MVQSVKGKTLKTRDLWEKEQYCCFVQMAHTRSREQKSHACLSNAVAPPPHVWPSVRVFIAEVGAEMLRMMKMWSFKEASAVATGVCGGAGEAGQQMVGGQLH